MVNSDDFPAGDAGRFLQVPRYSTDPESMMLRDLVRDAINEGLVSPLAIAPDRVVILLPDPSPDPVDPSPAGRDS